PLEREFKKLKRSRIPIVKIRWNSKRGPEFTWEREDQLKLKYPHLFSSRSGVGVDTAYPRYWIRRIGVSWSRDHARIRRIFLDGYGVLVVRIVIFKISSFKLQNARLLLIFTKYSDFYANAMRTNYAQVLCEPLCKDYLADCVAPAGRR
ncbi:hypothetical protein Tco_0870195, partial [Tanacetum coccineum]